MSRLSRPDRIIVLGLLVGIAGLLVQWFADRSEFADGQSEPALPFPPGILFVTASAVLMLLTLRWRWHPVFPVLIGVWIVGFGVISGQLTSNLVAPNVGTVVGNAVMSVGLVTAAVAGIVGMITGSGHRASAGRPEPAHANRA